LYSGDESHTIVSMWGGDFIDIEGLHSEEELAGCWSLSNQEFELWKTSKSEMVKNGWEEVSVSREVAFALGLGAKDSQNLELWRRVCRSEWSVAGCEVLLVP
jgi:hypothetical protein